jgi:hypothetical protein
MRHAPAWAILRHKPEIRLHRHAGRSGCRWLQSAAADILDTANAAYLKQAMAYPALQHLHTEQKGE